MYLRPETRAAHDRFWAALQTALLDHGVSAPSRLSDPVDLPKVWLRDDLCFSQTCSLPLRTRLRDQVTLIATPDYGLSGAPAGHYYSVFVARADDPRDAPAAFADAPFAFNEPSSHSGWCAPWQFAERDGFAFSNTVQTGGHRASARAVARRAS